MFTIDKGLLGGGDRMLLALGTRTLVWFGHGCSGDRIVLELERYYYHEGMDVRIFVCYPNVVIQTCLPPWFSDERRPCSESCKITVCRFERRIWISGFPIGTYAIFVLELATFSPARTRLVL